MGQFAIGGAGLIFTEATAVSPIGRISPYVCNALGLRYENELTVILHSTPQCTGIWSDDHVPGVERIVNFAHELQTAIGMQLAHAGNVIRAPNAASETRMRSEQFVMEQAERPLQNLRGWRAQKMAQYLKTTREVGR